MIREGAFSRRLMVGCEQRSRQLSGGRLTASLNSGSPRNASQSSASSYPQLARTLPLSRWGRQDLVQVCGTTRTVHRVLTDIRNQRGAHADVRWTQDQPQPVRSFYAFYASWFVVEVGLHLVQQAALAAKSSTFRRAVFDTDARIDLPIDYPLPVGHMTLSFEKGEAIEFGQADSRTLLYTPPGGPGTTCYSANLWFIRAPGEETAAEQAGIAGLQQLSVERIQEFEHRRD